MAVDFASVMRHVAQAKANREQTPITILSNGVTHTVQQADQPWPPGYLAHETVKPAQN
jgi:hypothetical protein